VIHGRQLKSNLEVGGRQCAMVPIEFVSPPIAITLARQASFATFEIKVVTFIVSTWEVNDVAICTEGSWRFDSMLSFCVSRETEGFRQLWKQTEVH